MNDPSAIRVAMAYMDHMTDQAQQRAEIIASFATAASILNEPGLMDCRNALLGIEHIAHNVNEAALVLSNAAPTVRQEGLPQVIKIRDEAREQYRGLKRIYDAMQDALG